MSATELVSIIGSGCSVLGLVITYGKFQYNIGTLTQQVKSQKEELTDMKQSSGKTTEKLFEKVDRLVEDMADVRANTDMMAKKIPEFVRKSDCKACS